jgi:uncharacterized protein
MRSLEEVLQSTSDILYPSELGERLVTIASRDCDGDSPLHVLLWRKDAEGAEQLVAAGADPNAVGDMGETPLHVAVKQNLLGTVEALLVAGAKPDICSEFGETPRDIAVAQGGAAARLFPAGGA